jgi:hypothetical protein
MSCVTTLQPGTMALSEQTLGSLDLSCDSGFVLSSFQIGWPAERAVVRNRALADGQLDDTRFVGGRAVTLTLRLDHRVSSTQALLNGLSPYLSARRRPTLTWSLAGSPTDYRSLSVRGVDMPTVIDGPKFPTVVAQFVSSDSFVRAPGERCVTMLPGEGELGRTYDLTFDRTYPPAGPDGSKNVPVYGTAPSDWVGTIFGAIDDPTITVNGITVEFIGLSLTASQTLVIDTAARTVLLDGDATESRYNLANYTDWTWDDLLLNPGDNIMRLTGDDVGVDAALTVCSHDRWFA